MPTLLELHMQKMQQKGIEAAKNPAAIVAPVTNTAAGQAPALRGPVENASHPTSVPASTGLVPLGSPAPTSQVPAAVPSFSIKLPPAKAPAMVQIMPPTPAKPSLSLAAALKPAQQAGNVQNNPAVPLRPVSGTQPMVVPQSAAPANLGPVPVTSQMLANPPLPGTASPKTPSPSGTAAVATSTLGENLTHFVNAEQPDQLTAEEIASFRSNLDTLVQCMDRPEFVGQACANIMRQLSADARFDTILSDADIGVMVGAFRKSYGVAASAAMAKASTKGTRKSKTDRFAASFALEMGTGPDAITSAEINPMMIVK